MHESSAYLPPANATVEINGSVLAGFTVDYGSVHLGCNISRNINQESGNLQVWQVEGETIQMNGVNNGATISLDCGLDAKCRTIGNNIKSLSSTLCGLSPTAGNFAGLKLNTQNEFDFIISVADSFGIAVVNISNNALFGDSSIGTVVVSTTASNLQLLVINIHGDSINAQNTNMNLDSAVFPNGIDAYAGIIWNFCEATSINFHSMVPGAVLAPYASVQFSSNIGGSLACASVVQTAELHMPLLKLPPCLG